MMVVPSYAMDPSKWSALTKGRICAYLLAHTQKVKKDKKEAARRSIPLLIQKMIIEYMDTDWIQLTEDMINWLSKPQLLCKTKYDGRLLCNDRYLLVKSDQHTYKLYDISNGMKKVGDTINNVNSIEYIIDDQYMRVKHFDAAVQLYDIKNNMQKIDNDAVQMVYSAHTPITLLDLIPDVTWSPNKQYRIERYNNKGELGLYYVGSGDDPQKIATLSQVSDVQFSSDSQYLWVKLFYNECQLYFMSDAYGLQPLLENKGPKIELSATGRYLVRRLKSGDISINDIEKDKVIGPLKNVSHIVFSQNDQYLFMHSVNRRYILRDMNTHTEKVHDGGMSLYDWDSDCIPLLDQNNEYVYYRDENNYLHGQLIQRDSLLKRIDSNGFALIAKIYNEHVSKMVQYEQNELAQRQFALLGFNSSFSSSVKFGKFPMDKPIVSEKTTLTKKEVSTYDALPQNVRLLLYKYVHHD